MARRKALPKKGAAKKSSGYLVAEPAGFPGVRIPLLSDEECKARGIEPARLPPFETWRPEQQAAFRELQQVLVELTVERVLRDMQSPSVSREADVDAPAPAPESREKA